MREKVHNGMKETNYMHRIKKEAEAAKSGRTRGADFLLSKLGPHYFSSVFRFYILLSPIPSFVPLSGGQPKTS